jgi:putative sterol carrier protein
MIKIPKGFRSDRANGVSAIIQFEFTDNNAWVLKIKDNICQVTQEVSSEAIMKIKTNSSIWKDIMLGKLDPMQAIMIDQVEISTDDMDLLMKFARMFKFSAETFL